MSRFRPIILLALVITAGFLIHSQLEKALLGHPEASPPLEDIDLHLIQGPWFEVARLESDIETPIKNPMLFVRFAGKGENGMYPYPDPDDPRFRIMLFGFDENSQRKTVLETYSDPIKDYRKGTLTIPCGHFFHCAYHLIALDDADHLWMIVAGQDLHHAWVFARGPGLPPPLLDTVKIRLHELGFNPDRLTYPNALPKIPEIPPAMPKVLPPIPQIPAPH